MADDEDIDIEEHDLMDNPKIRNILPELNLDLNIVKTEPIHNEDEVRHEEYEGYNAMSLRDTITYEDHEVDSNGDAIQDALHYDDNSDEYNMNSNKIILGTKPNASKPNDDDRSNFATEDDLVFSLPRNVKTEPIEYDDMNVDHDGMDFDDDIESPVIILGTIPDTPEVKERDVFASTVVLEDWGPRLQRSLCYCKQCDILFPTINCLDAHKMAVHSFLVAVDTNKAVKSTAKSTWLNTARNSTDNKADDFKAGVRYCNHCSKTFTYTSLIKHLYEILPTNEANYKCDDCDATFKKEADLNLHKQSHIVPTEDEVEEVKTYFKCPICSVYHYYKQALEKHLQRHHTIKNFQCKPEIFDGNCKFCQFSTLKIMFYNNHINTCHPSIVHKKVKLIPKPTLALKSAVKPNNIDINNANHSNMNSYKRFSYKCLRCNEIYLTKYAAKLHKKQKHSNVQGKIRLFTKICEDLSKIAVKPLIAHPDNPNKTIKIPKDVIYECNECNTHFTSCTVAQTHVSQFKCKKHKSDYLCIFCNRRFKNRDKTVHEMQHTVTQKFRVYVAQENLKDIVLCKCPNCNIYFYEEEFDAHTSKNCGYTPSKCGTCNLDIDISSIVKHKRVHARGNIQKEDFILVEYVKCLLRTESNVIEPSDTVVPKKESRFRTYMYCSWCSCCTRSVKTFKHHLERRCPKDPKRKRICKTCGLTINIEGKHERLHKTQPGLKLKDFVFRQIPDMKIIKPPIPCYPKCNKCNVNFISLTAQVKHECGDTFKTCKYCHMKFSDLALKLHVPLHEYKIKNSIAKQVQPNQSTASLAEDGDDLDSSNLENADELLKKYNSFRHVLYRCEICDIVCDSYELMVEHCQKHYSNLESFDMVVKECRKCDLKFDGCCFNKHQTLHKTNANLKTSFFAIFNYNYMSLHKNELWYKQFLKLPRPQMRQIIDNSIYRYVRYVKMTVIQDGSPEITLYKCAQCNRHVHPTLLTEHSDDCNLDLVAHRCTVCKLLFSTKYGRDSHLQLHRNFENVTTFRVVLINNIDDIEFNDAMAPKPDPNSDSVIHNGGHSKDNYENKSNDTPKAYKQGFTYVAAPKAIDGGTKFKPLSANMLHYYQCKNCKACFRTLGFSKKHVKCTTQTTKCNICGLIFSAKSGYRFKHIEMHKYKPKITVTEFDNSKYNDSSDRVAEVYKCDCGLHFINESTLEEHKDVCGTNISSENCSKCGLLFPTNVLVAHLCKHHGNGKISRIEVHKNKTKESKNSRKCIYKCKQCNVCFLTLSTITYHYKIHHSLVSDNITKCSKCALRFTRPSLVKHTSMHHSKKINMSDVKVKSFGPNAFSELKKIPIECNRSTVNLGKVLYKCSKCLLHFITFPLWLQHKRQKCLPNKTATKNVCTICKLHFDRLSLKKHQLIHHKKMKLRKATDFEIIIKRTDKAEIRNTELSNGKKIIIYKCTKCETHFIARLTLKNHLYRNRNRDCSLASASNREKCEFCGLYFMSLTITTHCLEHHGSHGANTAADFRILTSHSLSAIQNVTPEDSEVEGERTTLVDPPRNKHDSSDVDIVYKCLIQCDECSVYHLGMGGFRRHNDMKLHHIKLNCNLCRLDFGSEVTLVKHIEIHHGKLNYTAEDIEKRTLHSTEILTKTITNKLFKCNRCNMHLLQAMSFGDHLRNCKHSSLKELCDECNLLFGIKMLQTHKDVHHKKMNLRREDFIIYTDGEFTNADGELIKRPSSKYVQSINSTNKITLFKCNQCHNHYLTESTFRKHNCDSSSSTCKICHLNFSLNSLTRHLTLPHTGAGDFEILDNISCNPIENPSAIDSVYDTQSEDVDMDQSTITVDDDANDKINETESATSDNEESVVNSITERDRTPKTDLISPNLSISIADTKEAVLFKCMVCGVHCLYKDSAVTHSHTTQHEACDYCGLTFTSYVINRHIRKHHEKKNFKLEDFLIINHYDKTKNSDTPDLDSSIGKELTDSDALSQSSERSIESSSLSDNVTSIKKHHGRSYPLNVHMRNTLTSKDFDSTIYKCAHCPLHYLGLESAKHHEKSCDKSYTPSLKCVECDIEFALVHLPRHTYLHHEFLKLNKDSLKICQVSDEGCDSKPESITAMKTTKNEESIIAAERVPQSLDISQSEGSNTFDNSDVKDKSNVLHDHNKLFKCGNCNLHFLNEDYLDSHVEKRSHTGLKLECDHCGLNIDLKAIKIHRNIQHEELGLNLDDFEIITKFSEKTQTVKQEESNISQSNSEASSSPAENSKSKETPTTKIRKETKLYKCSTCNVYFMTQQACYKHTVKHTTLDFRDFIECKLCHLQFMIISLSKHITTHHATEFNVDEVLIEEYVPNSTGSTPKIDIYYAKDKLHTNLVSTTSCADDNVTESVQENSIDSIDLA